MLKTNGNASWSFWSLLSLPSQRLLCAFLAKKDKVLAGRQDNKCLTNSDLQAGSLLAMDCEIILSQNVLSQAIEELEKLDMTPAELSKDRVSVPTDTRILSITAKDGDPKEAARIATAFGMWQRSLLWPRCQMLRPWMKLRSASNTLSINTDAMSFLVLLLERAWWWFLKVVVEALDDRVKRPEDIEELMGLTHLVLCQILRNCRLGDLHEHVRNFQNNCKKPGRPKSTLMPWRPITNEWGRP